MSSKLRLVVGLGNPPTKYNRTRHNVGREFIDAQDGGSQPQFAKLACFMNESGPALLQLMAPDGITADQILVVVDDFMIPFGTLRLRPSGSSGGHNGLKSIIEALGTENFARLRVGVGPVPEGEDPAEFVLEKFSKDEQAQLPKIFDLIKSSIDVLASDGFQKAMNETNKAHL